MSLDPRIEKLLDEWEVGGRKQSIEVLCAKCPELKDELRPKIEALLTADRAMSTQVAETRPRCPGYRLIKQVGKGGQASVFHAIQLSTNRNVAIKVLHSGAWAGSSELARFDREAQVLAALKHPGIVSIIDRGMTQDGASFLAMEFVDGKSLDQWIKERRRAPERTGSGSPSEVLSLFLHICDAINAAHLRGIVHRDLKPANIFIDPSGQPKVLDFGLARPGFSPADGQEPVTLTGQFLGSLPWASPEQAEGASSRIDTRTDVYSLGVILYQLLTGAFPYEVAGKMRDVLNNIVTAQPPPPSEVLKARAARDEAKRRKKPQRPQLNPVIDAIVLKALSKRREERYQTAGDLAQDIAAYLAGRPTVAAGPIAQPRFGAVAKYSMTVAATMAVVLLIVGLMRRSGVTEPPDTVAIKPPDGGSTTLQPVPAKPSYPTTKPVVTPPTTTGGGATVTIPTKPPVPPVLSESFREPITPMALVQRPAAIKGAKSWTIETRGTQGPIHALAWSPDGKTLAIADASGSTRLWDADQHLVTRVFADWYTDVLALAWSPDGKRLATGINSATRVRDATTGAIVAESSLSMRGASVWSPESDRVALFKDKGVFTWRPGVGEPELAFTAKFEPYVDWPRGSATPVATPDIVTGLLKGGMQGDASFALSPDGSLAALTQGSVLRVWRVATGERLTEEKLSEPPDVIAWSFDSKRLAIAARNLVVWSGDTRQLSRPQPGLTDLRALAWHPDGKRLAMGCNASGVTICDVDVRKNLETVPRATDDFLHVALAPEGGRLAIGVSSGRDDSSDRVDAAYLVEVAGLDKPAQFPGITGGACLAWAAHVNLVLASKHEVLHAFNPADRSHVWTMNNVIGDGSRVDRIEVSPDGSRAIVIGNTGAAVIVDTLAGKAVHTFTGVSPVIRATWSPDSSQLAVSVGNKVRVWSAKDWTERRTIDLSIGVLESIAWSPDGKRLALVPQWYGDAIGIDVATGDRSTLYHAPRGFRIRAVSWRDATHFQACIASSSAVKMVAVGEGQPTIESNSPIFDELVTGSPVGMTPRVPYNAWTVGRSSRRVVWNTVSWTPLGTLLAMRGNKGPMLVSPDGHHNLSDPEQRLVYVVQTDDGRQLTLSPAEFTQDYGWKNNPNKASLRATMP